MVTINQLIDIVESIAGIEIQARLRSLRAQGRQRPQQRQHQDQEALLHWEPSISLREGLEKTYRWIYDQYAAREKGAAVLV